MSYDVAVWRGPRPTSDEAAQQEYERREPWEADSEAAPTSPPLAAFVADLLRRYPHDDEDSPWSTSPAECASGDDAYLTLSLRSEDEVLDVLGAAAAQHGLVAFDPQSGSLLPLPPQVRVTTSGDDADVDDPSEDGLLLLLEDLRQDGDFLVLDRTRDLLGQTYAQVLRRPDDLLLERRSGAPETHEHAVTADLRQAHHELTTWVFALDRPSVLRWSPGFG